jgi:putative addiction module component (TIGR02574 family)
MPKTLTELAEDAAALPGEEQLKLARILLELSESDSPFEPDIQEAWDKEIDHRLQELRSGKVKAVPLQEVRKRIESRFRS